MELTENIDYSHYKSLPKSIKILATQVAVYDFMFKHKLKSCAQLESYIELHFGLDPDILRSVEYNFWRRKLNGESLIKINGFKAFSAVMNQSVRILNHPFWRLLTTRKFDVNTVDGLMKRLSYTDRRIIRSSSRKTKSYPLKQSYSPQKQRLRKEESLDSLTALLLITIMEIRQYNKGRDSQTEQLAFDHFFNLFSTQYPIKSRDDLAIEIDKLLCAANNEFHIPFVEDEGENNVALAKMMTPTYFGKVYSKNIANGVFKITGQVA